MLPAERIARVCCGIRRGVHRAWVSVYDGACFRSQLVLEMFYFSGRLDAPTRLPIITRVRDKVQLDKKLQRTRSAEDQVLSLHDLRHTWLFHTIRILL